MKKLRALLATATAAGVTIALVACGSGTGATHVAAGHRAAGFPTYSGGQTRHYYIAADVVDWDYAPSGQEPDHAARTSPTTRTSSSAAGPAASDRCTRSRSTASTPTRPSRTLKPRPAKWEHLGMLGPVIRAEVGDKIVVDFKNNTPYPASVHPHGVFYKKDSEGAPYADGTNGADKLDDAVPTGGTHEYRWDVPERAGPGPMDGSSVMWMYHSHADEVPDQYSGLIGPMIVTTRGMARRRRQPEGRRPRVRDHVRGVGREPVAVALRQRGGPRDRPRRPRRTTSSARAT